MKGTFITFEGPDGSGKSTQLRRLADILIQHGYPVSITREPGGTIISDQIRQLLLSQDFVEMKDQTEILLYAASRAQHVHEKIIPLLQQGNIVLCDRFIDASIAYQAYGLGVDPQIVQHISMFASSGLTPLRTYLIDVPLDVSQQRMAQRAQHSHQHLDRIEAKHLEYHARVRNGFVELAKQHPKRIKWIDGHRDEHIISQEIKVDCLALLNEHTI